MMETSILLKDRTDQKANSYKQKTETNKQKTRQTTILITVKRKQTEKVGVV